MKKQSTANAAKNFLKFNGHDVSFTLVDGQWWIAIKPICQALGINYNRRFQELKKHLIFGELFASTQIVAADGKLRKMTCLPERYIYGWILSITPNSRMSEEVRDNLIAYQLECHDILYDHFKGTITRRQQLLNDREMAGKEKKELLQRLQANADYQRLKEIDAQGRKLNNSLKILDEELLDGQLDLWGKMVK